MSPETVEFVASQIPGFSPLFEIERRGNKYMGFNLENGQPGVAITDRRGNQLVIGKDMLNEICRMLNKATGGAP